MVRFQTVGDLCRPVDVLVRPYNNPVQNVSSSVGPVSDNLLKAIGVEKVKSLGGKRHGGTVIMNVKITKNTQLTVKGVRCVQKVRELF